MSSITSGFDKNFKNRKVVAWLTNKPKEEEKYEREQFFKILNQQIYTQSMQASIPVQNKSQ